MKKQIIEIDVPEGFEVKYDPKTYKIEMVKIHQEKKFEDLLVINGYYISNHSDIEIHGGRTTSYNRNVFPKREQAEAVLALAQLLQWRDRIIGGWIPDWKDTRQVKYSIVTFDNVIEVRDYIHKHNILSFPTEAEAKQFLKDHKALLETAKILL